MTLSCLCGQVRITVAARPDFVHECNCTLCSKTGARWAYMHPEGARVEGDTASTVRQDKAEPGARAHFCPNCGATTHFRLTESAVARFGDSMMGVNMNLAEPEDLAGIELRFPDGRGWSGDGEFSYVRPPRIYGEAA